MEEDGACGGKGGRHGDEEAMLEGIMWNDKHLEGMEEDGVRREDLVEAEVTVDEDEWEVIHLPPKMAVYETTMGENEGG
jgi:hypothetical protein